MRNLFALRGCVIAVLAVILFAATHAQTAKASGRYLEEDARLRGEQIHVFTDAGERISVVLGSFELEVGEVQVSGRDAVVWVLDREPGAVARRELNIYVEGDARVVEGDVTTTDSSMLVSVRLHGRLTAVGSVSHRSLRDFPLYQRAMEARRRDEDPSEPLAVAPVEPDRPDDVPPEDPDGPSVEPADPEDIERLTAAEPVSFHADGFTMEMLDEDRRVTIARGNVYLSQGDPDSDLFLELRSQAAVVFSERRPADEQPRRDERVPYAPDIDQLPGDDAEEVITGVYLAGDVVITRGDRMMRGPKAYYDFTTDRALVTDAVFRSVEELVDIPIYIRASEARTLSIRELWFRDAKLSTCDFKTPSYHVGAATAYLKDTTPYDPVTGEKLAERSYEGELTHTTFHFASVPLLYWPWAAGEFQEDQTPLRRLQAGRHGRFGYGVETEWHLFRLLGLVRPEGFDADLEVDWYERGLLLGTQLDYSRDDYSGNLLAYYIRDGKREDDFGRDREDIPAPRSRGRVLLRHKHLLPDDWQFQAELSHLSDRNFLEAFFPGEFHAGKEQETLLYAKRQQDSWAITGLMQFRINDFLTQTESLPEVAFRVIGQPLFGERMTFFHESRIGRKRYRPDDDLPDRHSDLHFRLDTRNELSMPLKVGPVNLLPYVLGRATWWEDSPPGGENFRLYGQVGARGSTHLYRVYDSVHSRVWNLDRLRHVVTPEVEFFFSEAGGVAPDDLWPMEPDIEGRLRGMFGWRVGLHQRLQTKRGPEGQQHTADWMRLDINAGFFSDTRDVPGGGRFFNTRPEHSTARNHIRADYAWHISDATTFLADANYDIDDNSLGRLGAGLAVSRHPRLRYYVGIRHLNDPDSTVGSLGAYYRISDKYTLSAFQQYDFSFDNGRNLATSLTLTRKLPRWNAAATFTYDDRTGDVSFYMTLSHEGIPDFNVGSGRTTLLSTSDLN